MTTYPNIVRLFCDRLSWQSNIRWMVAILLRQNRFSGKKINRTHDFLAVRDQTRLQDAVCSRISGLVIIYEGKVTGHIGGCGVNLKSADFVCTYLATVTAVQRGEIVAHNYVFHVFGGLLVLLQLGSHRSPMESVGNFSSYEYIAGSRSTYSVLTPATAVSATIFYT